MAVELSGILVEGASQWGELRKSILHGGYELLLWVPERQVWTEAGDGVKQIQDAVDSVLWKLFKFSICMEIDELVLQNDQQLKLKIGICHRLNQGEGDQYFDLEVEIEPLLHIWEEFVRLSLQIIEAINTVDDVAEVREKLWLLAGSDQFLV